MMSAPVMAFLQKQWFDDMRRNSIEYSTCATAAAAGRKDPISIGEIRAAIHRINHMILPEIRVNDFLCKGTGKPRMELAPQGIGPGHVYVSDKVRAETNAWMRERFGCENLVYKVDKSVFGREVIFVCQDDYDKAMAALG